METLTRSVVVDAPVRAAFKVALDPARLWKAKDVALANVRIDPDGTGTEAELWTHLLGFHLEGRLTYDEVVPNKHIVAQVHFMVEKPRWTFAFESAEGGTKVTATGQWESKLPVVGGSVEKMMAKEHEGFLEELLGNFKAQVESHKSAA